MVQIIRKPTRIQSAGNMPKIILEYVGRVNSQSSEVSMAHMKSPAGWTEPGQQPEFTEYTLVLKGSLQVETRTDVYRIDTGEVVMVPAGEWVRYSTPFPEGAEYIAVCIPAFSPETVHREE